MDYQEQLKTPFWKSKRNAILSRDNNSCQECFNQSIKSYSNKSSVISIICLDNQITALLNASDPRFRQDNPKYEVSFKKDQSDKSVANVYLNGWIQQLDLNLLIGMELGYVSTDNNLEEMKVGPSENIITYIMKHDNVGYYYVRGLHVHHKYYQEGLMAWEYPNEALVTLCWSCHEKLHENNTIPVYSLGKFTGRYLKPCSKCHGAGILPQFNHVQHGICFNCNGKKI